jgi:glycosyltransferase involved in cell wall biosynthesis
MSVLVSVILPVYNQQTYIAECLESLVCQTHSNLEIIIVNDGCSDGTMEVVEQFRDSRIRIISNEQNRGLAYSVNRGIDISNGKYIARMDADDVAVPSRFERQVKFMDHNPDIDVSGGGMKSFGYSSFMHEFPVLHNNCKAQLLFNVCFGHPTVIFRKKVFDHGNRYDERLKQYSEEYELWCRLVDRYRFANLPEVLIHYRTFSPAAKNEAILLQKRNSREIRKRLIEEQFEPVSEESLLMHDNICNLHPVKSKTEFQKLLKWLESIEELNTRHKSFDPDALQLELDKRRFELYYWNGTLGLANSMGWFFRQPKRFKPSFMKSIRLLLKPIVS